MLYAVDHGNYAMKTLHCAFTSGLAEHTVRPPLATDILEYQGKFWSLTEQRINYMRDKTKDDRYFILTLFAIAKEMQNNGGVPAFVEAELAVGLPPEHFSTLKDKFAQYLQRERVKFVYNDQPCCMTVRQVFVYPQAYAAVVPQGALLKDCPRMFVLDIGGYTTDVLLLRNSRPDLQFCRSLNMGVITMCNDIIGKVGSRHDMMIEDDHIVSLLQGKNTILPSDVKETISGAVAQHAANILDKLRELQVDLRSNPAIFIGGGAALFKPYFDSSPLVTKADYILDVRANAIGYSMLATAQMKRNSA